MKANGIEQEMTYYFMQLNEAEKKSVMAMIKAFLQSRSNGKGPIDLYEYNHDIDEALAEAERGECYTHEEVVTMSKNW